MSRSGCCDVTVSRAECCVVTVSRRQRRWLGVRRVTLATYPLGAKLRLGGAVRCLQATEVQGAQAKYIEVTERGRRTRAVAVQLYPSSLIYVSGRAVKLRTSCRYQHSFLQKLQSIVQVRIQGAGRWDGRPPLGRSLTIQDILFNSIRVPVSEKDHWAPSPERNPVSALVVYDILDILDRLL